MKKDYPSRIDGWVYAMIGIAPIFCLIVGVAVFSKAPGIGLFVIALGFGIGALMAVLSFPCVYTLTDNTLKTRCGVMEDEISLLKVKGAEKTSSLWATPALSVRRVKITLEDGSMMISPSDREGFLADLESRLQQAKVATQAPEPTPQSGVG